MIDPKIFYVGINWERLSKRPGRHEDTLRVLDGAGVVKIYGPKRIRNVDVWRGFKGYCGEIPFDGASIIDRIADCGISLVLSSDAHVQSELMSNRLFESLAAGAVIICDDNEFARMNFANTLLYIKHSPDPREMVSQILVHYRWICEHRTAALDLAKRAQAVFLRKFRLDAQLRTLIMSHRTRVAKMRRKVHARSQARPVHVFLPLFQCDPSDLANRLANLSVQLYSHLIAHVLVPDTFRREHNFPISSLCRKSPVKVEIAPTRMFDSRSRRLPLGSILAPHLEQLPDQSLILVMLHGERWFSDHVTTLVRLFENDPTLQMAISDYLLKHSDPSGEEFRDYFDARTLLERWPYSILGNQMCAKAALVNVPPQFARYLDSRNLFRTLRLQAGQSCAYTRRATYMLNIQMQEQDQYACSVEDDIQTAVSREYANALGAPPVELPAQNGSIPLDGERSYQWFALLHRSMTTGERQSIVIMFLKEFFPPWIWRTLRWVYRFRQLPRILIGGRSR